MTRRDFSPGPADSLYERRGSLTSDGVGFEWVTTMRFAQWMMGLAVVAVSGVGTYWLLAPQEAERLRLENEQLAQERMELQQVVERLVVEHRVAEVHVIDQIRKGEWLNGREADRTLTTIEFIELDRQGHPLPSRRFVLEDEVIFFDGLVIKFDHEHVATGDALRGRNLVLFRRIFGEHQQPAEGYWIDPKGDVPNIYRVNPEPGTLERKLWSRFWDYATNPDLAAKQGVRVAQGEAVYAPMRRGQIWSLTLENTGGLNLKLHRTAKGQPSATEARSLDQAPSSTNGSVSD